MVWRKMHFVLQGEPQVTILLSFDTIVLKKNYKNYITTIAAHVDV